MKKKLDNVYQFKIALVDSDPPIWRRIQVSETYSFGDLHHAIQRAMGWDSYHSYDFYIDDIRVESDEPGFYIDDMWRDMPPVDSGPSTVKTLPAGETKLKKFMNKGKKFTYIYDLGDRWEHTVELEKILISKNDTDYPRCLAGESACPPEDCGGIMGYEDFLEAIDDPSHPQHEEMLDWIGGEFDPEHFDPDEVVF